MRILFGDTLRRLREARALTQGEVARRLDCTPKMISNYELNKREPDFVTFCALCNLYDVTADYLLGRSDEEKYFYQTPISGEQQELLNYFKLLSDEAKSDTMKYIKMQAIVELSGVDDYQQLLRIRLDRDKNEQAVAADTEESSVGAETVDKDRAAEELL